MKCPKCGEFNSDKSEHCFDCNTELNFNISPETNNAVVQADVHLNPINDINTVAGTQQISETQPMPTYSYTAEMPGTQKKNFRVLIIISTLAVLVVALSLGVLALLLNREKAEDIPLSGSQITDENKYAVDDSIIPLETEVIPPVILNYDFFVNKLREYTDKPIIVIEIHDFDNDGILECFVVVGDSVLSEISEAYDDPPPELYFITENDVILLEDNLYGSPHDIKIIGDLKFFAWESNWGTRTGTSDGTIVYSVKDSVSFEVNISREIAHFDIQNGIITGTTFDYDSNPTTRIINYFDFNEATIEFLPRVNEIVTSPPADTFEFIQPGNICIICNGIIGICPGCGYCAYCDFFERCSNCGYGGDCCFCGSSFQNNFTSANPFLGSWSDMFGLYTWEFGADGIQYQYTIGIFTGILGYEFTSDILTLYDPTSGEVVSVIPYEISGNTLTMDLPNEDMPGGSVTTNFYKAW
ncbi:MAG: hypothetical protein FWD48_08845 [Oscillospiraceae bacterium]|nr:hypothetical protein [Oscillospiraceae bacterium]